MFAFLTKSRIISWRWSIILGCAMMMGGCGEKAPNSHQIRVGYFPNITHAQALVGLADGTFQKSLGEEVHIQTFVLNAGPAAIEAVFAGELDVVYIGPNPAINGFVKSKGQALRIIAGAASGGAVLVAHPKSGINSVADFPGKRIATPQLGNTQDIALRYYLKQNNLAPEEQGGTVKVLPMQNADILSGFLQGTLDAAWVPEPWGARLIREAEGRLIADERDLWPEKIFPTAVVIVTTRFLQQNPELVKRWLRAHVEVTQWIQANPDQAKRQINAELDRLTGKPVAAGVLDEAWGRLAVTYDPLAVPLAAAASHAFDVGFLGEKMPDLTQLIEIGILNTVLKEKGLAGVSGS